MTPLRAEKAQTLSLSHFALYQIKRGSQFLSLLYMIRTVALTGVFPIKSTSAATLFGAIGFSLTAKAHKQC